MTKEHDLAIVPVPACETDKIPSACVTLLKVQEGVERALVMSFLPEISAYIR